MRITDVIKVDANYRQYRKAQTLLANIERREDYYRKNHNTSYSMGHHRRAQEAKDQLKQYIHRLDKNEFKSDTPKLVKQSVDSTMGEIFTNLPKPGKAQYNDLQVSIIEQMNTIGKDVRAKQHRTLLLYEIALRAKQKWYIIFNTLTVAPGEYNNVFARDSKAFANYIRTLDARIGTAAYGSIRRAKGHDYHTYFAVVEEGAEHGRLHIHCVHMCRSLPIGSRDPNYGKTVPTHRELGTFKALWPHGYSSPYMVRYSPEDGFGLLGYRWPYDTRTEKPLAIGSPLKLANYLTKYIVKSYQSNKRKKLLWRVRKSQNLGKPILQELLSTLTPDSLLSVASNNSLNLKINNQKIPSQILRTEALVLYKSRNSSKNPRHSLSQMARQLQPRPSLLRSSNASTQSLTTYSQRNSGNTPTKLTNPEDTFKEAWSELKQAGQRINDKYFEQSNNLSGTTSIKDHIY